MQMTFQNLPSDNSCRTDRLSIISKDSSSAAQIVLCTERALQSRLQRHDTRPRPRPLVVGCRSSAAVRQRRGKFLVWRVFLQDMISSLDKNVKRKYYKFLQRRGSTYTKLYRWPILFSTPFYLAHSVVDFLCIMDWVLTRFYS